MHVQHPEPSGQLPEELYQERCARFAERREHYNRLSHRNANVNLALIAAALICLGIGLWLDSSSWLIPMALFVIGFVISYVYHGRVDRTHRRYDQLWQINHEGLLRLKRDWRTLPLREPPPPSQHPYAADLDLLGHASLLHLIGIARTPVGQATLQRWILHPADREAVEQRQVAVAELAPMVDFRDELALQAEPLATIQSNYEQFLHWAEGEPWHMRPWMLWSIRLLPLLMLVALLGQILGWLQAPIWLILAAVHLGLLKLAVRYTGPILDEVVVRQGIFQAYTELFQLIGTQSFVSPCLKRLQGDLSAAGIRADQQMRRLARLMPLIDIRQNMFFFPIQIATLWDMHVAWLLDRWRRQAGGQARAWLAALGEIEALIGLATLKHDHPDWIFPSLVEVQPPVLRAHSLGHPLLPPATRVDNDVEIGPPGTFLLVTGSNMSGKSTLLRAIGVNIVLAQAGGPVCARLFQMPPLVLATSMRVQDSLEQGLSFFMAELKRLKIVVEAAQQAQPSGDRTLLYLLDEILHGTNTSERQIAARQIIRHLLSQGAIGAVSTHDLTLADSPDLAQASHQVHFTETVLDGPEGVTMHFDYRLRPGLATSTNALVLLRQLMGPRFEL